MMPDPLSPYAVTKLAGENYCSVFSRLFGMHCTCLRYFNVFGPRQDPASPYSGVITKFIMSVLAHQPVVIYGDGSQTRDFVFVKDVVHANIGAMENEKTGSYNIADSHQINLKELASMIMEIIGITVPFEFEPPRVGDVRDSLADISHAQRAFGYSPQYAVRA